jgi:hypothetical protein
MFMNGSLIREVSAFDPIKDLLASGGDIYLISLSGNAITFSEKSLDPWYQATRDGGTIRSLVDAESDLDVYIMDEPGSPLACSEKVQLRFKSATGEDRYTILSGYNDVNQHASALFEGDPSSSRWNWLLQSINNNYCFLTNILDILGQQALLSRKSVYNAIQGPLGTTQWMEEVDNWLKILTMCKQRAFVEAAKGPPPSLSGEEMQQYIVRPVDAAESSMCHNQVSRVVMTEQCLHPTLRG